MIDLRGRTHEIYDAVRHATVIFPDDTSKTVTLTAGLNAHTWSNWTEIADSGATTFSSKFATTPGHITSMVVETISDNNAIYMLEIAWGAAKNLITTCRFAGIGKFQAPNHTRRFWAPSFEAGETVYYRMKTETAVADTCTIHFRYHIH